MRFAIKQHNIVISEDDLITHYLFA